MYYENMFSFIYFFIYITFQRKITRTIRYFLKTLNYSKIMIFTQRLSWGSKEILIIVI